MNDTQPEHTETPQEFWYTKLLPVLSGFITGGLCITSCMALTGLFWTHPWGGFIPALPLIVTLGSFMLYWMPRIFPSRKFTHFIQACGFVLLIALNFGEFVPGPGFVYAVHSIIFAFTILSLQYEVTQTIRNGASKHRRLVPVALYALAGIAAGISLYVGLDMGLSTIAQAYTACLIIALFLRYAGSDHSALRRNIPLKKRDFRHSHAEDSAALLTALFFAAGSIYVETSRNFDFMAAGFVSLACLYLYDNRWLFAFAVSFCILLIHPF